MIKQIFIMCFCGKQRRHLRRMSDCHLHDVGMKRVGPCNRVQNFFGF